MCFSVPFDVTNGRWDRLRYCRRFGDAELQYTARRNRRLAILDRLVLLARLSGIFLLSQERWNASRRRGERAPLPIAHGTSCKPCCAAAADPHPAMFLCREICR